MDIISYLYSCFFEIFLLLSFRHANVFHTIGSYWPFSQALHRKKHTKTSLKVINMIFCTISSLLNPYDTCLDYSIDPYSIVVKIQGLFILPTCSGQNHVVKILHFEYLLCQCWHWFLVINCRLYSCRQDCVYIYIHIYTWWGCERVETHVCGMWENKGVLALGNLNRARVHLTPKARFVWLVWSLCASCPWLSYKRWARARFCWSRAQYACSVRALNFWYVQHDCVNISEWQKWSVKQYIVRGPCVTASQMTQNNKPQSRCTPLCCRRALLSDSSRAIRNFLFHTYEVMITSTFILFC